MSSPRKRKAFEGFFERMVVRGADELGAALTNGSNLAQPGSSYLPQDRASSFLDELRQLGREQLDRQGRDGHAQDHERGYGRDD